MAYPALTALRPTVTFGVIVCVCYFKSFTLHLQLKLCWLLWRTWRRSWRPCSIESIKDLPFKGRLRQCATWIAQRPRSVEEHKRYEKWCQSISSRVRFKVAKWVRWVSCRCQMFLLVHRNMLCQTHNTVIPQQMSTAQRPVYHFALLRSSQLAQGKEEFISWGTIWCLTISCIFVATKTMFHNWMKCNITCFPEKPHHLSWIRVACQQKGSFRTLATGRFSGVCQYLRSAILSSFVSSVIQQEGWTSKDRGRTSAGRGRRWLWSWGGSTSKSRCFIEAIEFLPFTLGVLMSHWFFLFFVSARLWCIIVAKQQLGDAARRSVWTFVSRRSVPGQHLSEVHVRWKGHPPEAEQPSANAVGARSNWRLHPTHCLSRILPSNDTR